MATIKFIWNGEDDYTTESATVYYRGIGQGYYVPPGYRESWTGLNFAYTGNDGHPTSGTLKSWTFQQTGTTFAYTVTDLNYKIPAGATYTDLIAALSPGATTGTAMAATTTSTGASAATPTTAVPGSIPWIRWATRKQCSSATSPPSRATGT